MLGLVGGIGADAANLLHMRSVADRLLGDRHHVSVIGAGKHQMAMATINALMGGHARVGLEDSLYIRRGALAESNAQQVEKIIRVLGELSLETATPDEARAMLGLKGRSAPARS